MRILSPEEIVELYNFNIIHYNRFSNKYFTYLKESMKFD